MQSGRVKAKKEHLITTDETAKDLLKFAAIYGRNGAGKSNFIRALDTLKNFVVHGRAPQKAAELWCRSDPANEGHPSCFRISFVAEGSLFEYTVSVVLSTGTVAEEALVLVRGNRRTALFTKEAAGSPYVFHNSIRGRTRDIEVLSRSFDMSGKPFLHSINSGTIGFFMQNPQAGVLRDVYLWFRFTLEIIFPDQPMQETSLLEYNLCKDEFARLLNEFDTGITGIRLEEVSKERVFQELGTHMQHIVNNDMLAAVERQHGGGGVNAMVKKDPPGGTYASVIRNRRNIFIINLGENGTFSFYILKFVHRLGTHEVEFTMERESDGTHRLFQLLEMLVSRKKKVYVIDEINRCLHPLLVVRFVKKYLETAETCDMQLVTTTHETYIIGNKADLVRRDEVWIAGVNGDGSTSLKCLEEERVRADKSLDDNYLDGVWGGVPEFPEDEKTGEAE